MSKNVPNPQVTNEVNKFIKNKLNKPQKNQNLNAKREFKILNKVSGNQDQVQVGKNEPTYQGNYPAQPKFPPQMGKEMNKLQVVRSARLAKKTAIKSADTTAGQNSHPLKEKKNLRD